MAAVKRTILIAEFDVTHLSEEEREQLILEIAVQAERSDGHPSVPDPTVREEKRA